MLMVCWVGIVPMIMGKMSDMYMIVVCLWKSADMVARSVVAGLLAL